MKKFNSFRNRQNGFEDLGSGTAEAAKTKKRWWKVPGIILVILVIAIFAFNSTYQIREQAVSYTHLDVYKRQIHWGAIPVALVMNLLIYGWVIFLKPFKEKKA